MYRTIFKVLIIIMGVSIVQTQLLRAVRTPIIVSSTGEIPEERPPKRRIHPPLPLLLTYAEVLMRGLPPAPSASATAPCAT